VAVHLNPIEAHERRVGEVFSDLYAYEIPPYQRPYAWEEENAKALLTDLIQAMDNRKSDGAYFLGSIVLIKLPNDPLSKVIDGQQRLTTLTILLSVLRDLTSDPETAFSRRTYVFQKANADSGATDRFRLLLRQRDRAFFQKYIQTPKATDHLPALNNLDESQARIAENASYFRKTLEKMDEARRNELVAFIIQHCYVVIVAVPTADSARRIFTVLNARGMDLTPTDMLKANLLERAGPMREAELAERWEAVELALGREEMVALFGHIRMLYERDKPRVALETSFSEIVKPFSENAENFISELLEPIADAYILLTDNKTIKLQFGEQAAKALRSLERIDNKDWIPPALLRLWKRGKDDVTAISSYLTSLERLAYFLFVTRADVNERIARYSAVMDEFDPRPDKAKPTNGMILSKSDQQDFLNSLAGSLYLKKRVCRPVLERLDEALSSGGAIYDQVVSIEHVLPQTVEDGSEWSKLFFDEEVRARWVHRIANLVLLTRRINSRASNWDFQRKKDEYFVSKGGRSPFPLTQEVLEAKRWDLAHLEKRQSVLLQKLCEVWDIDPNLIESVDTENGNSAKQSAIEGTWRDDVRSALQQLGGKADLDTIYRQVKKVRETSNRTVPSSLDAIVRRTLEQNCADTESYLGLYDLFQMPNGKGAGIWALR
jgi:hypothetical protein